MEEGMYISPEHLIIGRDRLYAYIKQLHYNNDNNNNNNNNNMTLKIIN